MTGWRKRIHSVEEAEEKLRVYVEGYGTCAGSTVTSERDWARREVLPTSRPAADDDDDDDDATAGASRRTRAPAGRAESPSNAGSTASHVCSARL